MAKQSKKIKSAEGLGISGFTLGILSIILAGWIGIMVSIIGFIFCFIQQRKYPTKLGKAGLILNVIGFIVSVILIIIFIKNIYPALQGLS